MSVKIKKSVFKAAVKEVVRECLNERIQEGCGKWKRMAQHVAKSEREAGKGAERAKDIGYATATKQLGKPDQEMNEIGAESRDSALDDVVRFVIKKAPAIKDPEKLGRVVSLLFKHQMGFDADPDALQQSIAKHWRVSDTASPTTPTDEAGLTSEDDMPQVPSTPGDMEGGHEYDEKEEIMLIKVMKKCAEKLEAMHAGMPGAEEEPEVEVEPEEPEGGEAPPFGGEEEPEGGEGGEEEEPSEAPPFGGEEEPEGGEEEEPEEPKDDEEDEDPIKEVAARTQTQMYRVAPNPSCVTQKDEIEKLKANTPPLAEKKTAGKGQYKVVAPRQARMAKDDHARRIQNEPKVTENHKTQKRSYKTVQDVDNDPQNVRDPDVPQA